MSALKMHAAHPSNRSYVLKLHRDADPRSGRLFGRLESLCSGRRFDFASAEELLACLSLDAPDEPGPQSDTSKE